MKTVNFSETMEACDLKVGRYRQLIDFMKVCLFVWVKALCPSQQFFSHVGTKPPLPGYYQYFLGR